MRARPEDLYDRVEEWQDLSALVAPRAAGTGMRIGIVSGRRRHGKSFVLRRLVDTDDGLYHQARELERPLALAQFAADTADRLGYDPDALRFDSWETALRVALGMPRAGSRSRRRAGARVLVIDELPYLLGHSPEIPSILQLLHDEAASDPAAPSTAVILCGSSLSVMADLLAGTKPLRGRAQLDMTMRSFDFRQSREYWDVAEAQVAFHLDAILGGTPGYKQLVTAPPPATLDELPAWLAAQVLNPAGALFNEKSFLLREDPRNLDKALYNSILQAIADGKHSPTAIGGVVGRDYNALKHPLSVLESAGFLLRVEDVLTRKRPAYFLADPIVRFSQVVIDPYRALLEERDAPAAWEAAAGAYSTHVLGPHFEHLARVWTAKFSGERWGTPIGEVGPAVINDPRERKQHELDVVALARGRKRHDEKAPIVVLGEAKSTNRLRTLADLHRLETLRSLLVATGRDAAGAQLAIFSRDGFEPNLIEAAKTRSEVHLVDLAALYATAEQVS